MTDVVTITTDITTTADRVVIMTGIMTGIMTEITTIVTATVLGRPVDTVADESHLRGEFITTIAVITTIVHVTIMLIMVGLAGTIVTVHASTDTKRRRFTTRLNPVVILVHREVRTARVAKMRSSISSGTRE